MAKRRITNRNYKWDRLGLELLVVFLGVTAGFLLNNWRMKKNTEQLEVKYISGFLLDVEANITELTSFIESDSLWLAQASPVLQSLQNNTLKPSDAKKAITKTVQMSAPEIRTGTYEQITNSGNLNIIEDFNLRSMIVDYKVSIDNAGFVNKYFYDYFRDHVMSFAIEELDLVKDTLVNEEIVYTA